MGENSKSTDAPKKGFWKGLKAEYSKIIFPTKETLVKETGAVVVYTAVLAVLIMALDFVFQFGVDKLLSW